MKIEFFLFVFIIFARIKMTAVLTCGFGSHTLFSLLFRTAEFVEVLVQQCGLML